MMPNFHFFPQIIQNHYPSSQGGRGGGILKNVLIQKVQTELQRLENLREVRMEEVEGMLNSINNLYQKLTIPGAGLEAYPCFKEISRVVTKILVYRKLNLISNMQVYPTIYCRTIYYNLKRRGRKDVH